MEFDSQHVLLNVRKASTDDLLDRITVYREGMEPQAVRIIEAELLDRGVSDVLIDAHAARLFAECLFDSQGVAFKCSFCHKPAVFRDWDWHRVLGFVPLFPRTYYFCREHCPPEALPPRESQ